MVLVTHLALLAATALPQGPDRDPPVRHADVIPANALAVVSSAPWDDHRATLAASGLDRILIAQGGILPRLRRGALARLLGANAAEIAVLDDLGSDGMSIAILTPDAVGTPGALAAVDVDADRAEQLRTALDRRSDADAGITAIAVGAGGGYRVETPAWNFVMAVLDDRILLASSLEVLAAAVGRAAGPAEDALAASPRYGSFAKSREDTASTETWLLTTFVDLTEVTRWALSATPRPERDEIATWIDRTGLGTLESLGVSVGQRDEQVVERMWVGAPGSRGALLTALVPTGPVDTGDLATLVPADVTSFAAARIRLHDVWTATMRMLDRDAPETAGQVRAMAGLAGTQLGGIDIERDLLSTLGERMISMSWPTTANGAGSDTLAIVDLAHGDRLATTFARMSIFESSPLAGYELFLTDGDVGSAALAIGEERLVLASSERRLRRWITDRRDAAPNPNVEHTLQRLPRDVAAFGVVDIGRAALDALSSLDAAEGMLPPEADFLRQLLADASAGAGTVSYAMRGDDEGYTLSVDSGGGSAVRLAVATVEALGEGLCEDPDVATMLVHARSVDRSRGARSLAVLRAIRRAQQQHLEQQGAFAELDTLIETGLMPADLLDSQVEPHVHVVGDSLVTVLLSAEQTSAGFAAVMWPTDRRPGAVLACSDQREPQRNELIARISGLGRPELSDLFVDGDLHAGWTPGWRVLDQGEPTAVVNDHTTDSTTFRVLTALEQQGESGARELAEYLDHADPLVAARAAWSLGRLRHTPAIPALIGLVQSHHSAEVRRHAMAALRVMRDPSTAAVSTTALSDSDTIVRMLAATNLGALRHQDAKDALVAVLSTTDDEQPDDQDAIAALLALGDLADPEQLLLAATAFERESTEAEEALVWLFQQLSPSLQPESESTVLMAVLDHRSPLLRRFAIQRLGELAEPRTAAALEARLAQESDELRPLIEVSLAAVRGDAESGEEGGGFAAFAEPWIARAKTTWNDPDNRTIILASGAGVLVLLVGLMVAVRHRRRRRRANDWAAMTRPSTGFDAENGLADTAPRYEEYDPELGDDALDETGAPVDWDEGEPYEDEVQQLSADEAGWGSDEATHP